jgi:hypothetical protein
MLPLNVAGGVAKGLPPVLPEMLSNYHIVTVFSEIP